MNKKTHVSRTLLSFPQSRHRSAGFIVSGFAVATVIVTALFWIMYQLISIVQVDVPPETRPPGIFIVDWKPKVLEPRKRERKPAPPPVFKQPLPTSTAKWASTSGVPSFRFIPPSKNDLFGEKVGGKIGIGEREYMPLTEIQPNYPERALVRGIEGTCVVIYTITKTGSVQDVRVDPSRCTSTLFHSSAMKAANKFKYAPRIVDGETIEARNVIKLFRFSITQ